jgi:hypothetical protein
LTLPYRKQLGRFAVTWEKESKGRFKVPTYTFKYPDD